MFHSGLLLVKTPPFCHTTVTASRNRTYFPAAPNSQNPGNKLKSEDAQWAPEKKVMAPPISTAYRSLSFSPKVERSRTCDIAERGDSWQTAREGDIAEKGDQSPRNTKYMSKLLKYKDIVSSFLSWDPGTAQVLVSWWKGPLWPLPAYIARAWGTQVWEPSQLSSASILMCVYTPLGPGCGVGEDSGMPVLWL